MQPRLPTKHMIGIPSCSRVIEHRRQRIAVELPGIVLADHAHRLVAAQLQRLQHAEELMHVGQPAPAVAQIVDARRLARRRSASPSAAVERRPSGDWSAEASSATSF